MRTVCIMFLFGMLLQGCGHKGPLFLPKPKPAQPAPQAAPQQAEPQSSPPK